MLFRSLVSASWKDELFEIIADKSLEASTNGGKNTRRYRVYCTPLFALIIHHEAMSLKLWERASELGVKGHGHYIIRNSDWIDSLKAHEKYGYDWHEGEAVHYVFTADPEVIHIISKEQPKFEVLKEWREEASSISTSLPPWGPIAVLSKKKEGN